MVSLMKHRVFKSHALAYEDELHGRNMATYDDVKFVSRHSFTERFSFSTAWWSRTTNQPYENNVVEVLTHYFKRSIKQLSQWVVILH